MKEAAPDATSTTPFPDPISLGKSIGSGLVSGAGKFYGAFAGTLRISLIGSDNVSYYRTPDAPPNREIFDQLPRLSYTFFRVKLQIGSSYKVRIHRTSIYAYQPDPKSWELLSGVDMLTQHDFIRHSLRQFASANSHPSIPESEKLDNDGRNCDLDIEPSGSQEMVIARVGAFRYTLPDERIQIRGNSFTEVLILVYLNTSIVCLLCALPLHRSSHGEDARPVILKATKKAVTDVKGAVGWGSRNLPVPRRQLKERSSITFFVKIR